MLCVAVWVVDGQLKMGVESIRQQSFEMLCRPELSLLSIGKILAGVEVVTCGGEFPLPLPSEVLICWPWFCRVPLPIHVGRPNSSRGTPVVPEFDA